MRQVVLVGTPFWLLLTLLTAAGCGQQEEHFVSGLEVTRRGWDTLRVDMTVQERTRFGGPEPVVPEETVVNVFNAQYDTLYSGSGPLIPLDDTRLGDREQVLVEVCQAVSSAVLCEQESVAASAKRIRVEQDITYPEDSSYERGSYDFHFVVERQQFGTDSWEQIDVAERVGGYLLAYVEDAENEPVRVPLEGQQGRFDLTRYENNRDFQYYLKSKLLDEREASVRFELHGGLNGQATRLASLEKRVRVKTQEERMAEVEFFVQQATEQLLDRLDFFDRARVYVNRWHYDEFEGTYVVDAEVWGRSSFFRRFALEGTLELQENGREALFRFREGNHRAEQSWERAVGGKVLELGPLEPMPESEGPETETPAELTSTSDSGV